jgi:hypothetical protein
LKTICIKYFKEFQVVLIVKLVMDKEKLFAISIRICFMQYPNAIKIIIKIYIDSVPKISRLTSTSTVLMFCELHKESYFHSCVISLRGTKNIYTHFNGSRDSSVGIATGYGLDDREVEVSPGRVQKLYFSKSSTLALGSTLPLIQWVTGALSPGVKQPGRKADHSPPTSANVNKMWIYTSTPLHSDIRDRNIQLTAF